MISPEVKIDLSRQEAFQSFFNDYYVPLCLFCRHYMESEEQTSDIVQDAFIKLWQRNKDFEYQHQAKAFLYTTVRNSALNELEHLHIVKNYATTMLEKTKDSFFTDHVIEEEMHRILVQAIEKLPAQSRRLMMLSLEGKQNAQIAEELSISSETVHSLKKIAYKKLRTYLKEYYYLIFFL